MFGNIDFFLEDIHLARISRELTADGELKFQVFFNSLEQPGSKPWILIGYRRIIFGRVSYILYDGDNTIISVRHSSERDNGADETFITCDPDPRPSDALLKFWSKEFLDELGEE